MTHREHILAVLKGGRIGVPPFVPEMLVWYKFNRNAGTLPPRYRNSSVVEICADLDIGMLPLYYCGQHQDGADVIVVERASGNRRQTVIKTPVGEVSSEHEISDRLDWTVSNFIRRAEDIEVMKYVCQRRKLLVAGEDKDYGDLAAFEREVGPRGVVRVNLPRLSLMRFFIDFSDYETGIFLLHDYPERVDDLLAAIESSEDSVFESAGKLPAMIFNFGDNIDTTINPGMFRKYCIPHYQKWTAQLRANGKICFCHMDGDISHILPLIPGSGIDCVDGMPLFPMSKMKPADVRNLVRQGVCIFGILPASLFIPSGALDLLKEEVLAVKEISKEYGRIVLGVSDEFPPDGELDRIKFVQDLLAAG